jgi:hypothetical protein
MTDRNPDIERGFDQFSGHDSGHDPAENEPTTNIPYSRNIVRDDAISSNRERFL